MTLADLWFLVICFLFTGFFVLEGFDFGVGTLLPVLGRDDTERRVMINTIAPVWDANETWLIVAAGAMFAAFPHWYAAAFSTFYLPLLLILLTLIVRGVGFEYRGKVDSAGWRRRWDAAITAGSVVPPLLWGLLFADMVRGVPLDADGNFTGDLRDLFGPYALLGGAAFLALFVLHGGVFVALRTVGGIRHSARRAAGRAGLATLVLLGAFLLWTTLAHGGAVSLAVALVALVAVAGALVTNAREREGLAFALTAVSVAGTIATLFTALAPDLLRSIDDPARNVTIANAASGTYTLTVMTWIAAVATPFVLLYQGWTYWVFRARLGRGSIPTRPQHGAGTGPAGS